MVRPSKTTIGGIPASKSQKLHDANVPSCRPSFNPSSPRIYLYSMNACKCLTVSSYRRTVLGIQILSHDKVVTVENQDLPHQTQRTEAYIYPRVYVFPRMCTLLLLMLHLLLRTVALVCRLCTALLSSSTSLIETDAGLHCNLRRLHTVLPILKHRKGHTESETGQQKRQS